MKAMNERGLTVVEIIVAIVILAIGLLVLAGGALVVTQDLTRSGLQTQASQIGQAKLDELRTYAAGTEPRCISAKFASSASPVTVGKVTLSWTVGASGSQRVVRVRTQYALPAGRSRTDTLRSYIGC